VRRQFYDVEQQSRPSPVAQKALAWIVNPYAIEAEIKESPLDQSVSTNSCRGTGKFPQ
jgi:hypothetical protein